MNVIGGEWSATARTLHRDAADELLEDAVAVLGILEVLNPDVALDPKGVAACAGMLVEKLRRAQRHIRSAL